MTAERKQVGTKLDAALYRQARARALVEGRNVGELIDEAVRDYLGLKDSPAVPKRTKYSSSKKARG